MTTTLPWPRLLDPALSLVIPGKPISQGNPQAFTNGGKAYPKVTVNHRNLVIALMISEWDGQPAITGAVRVMVRFGFARPAAHFRPVNSKRTERELRPEAPEQHCQKPDVDKLVRLLFDAATIAGVLADDSLVTKVIADKVWADSDYTELWIYKEDTCLR